MRKNPALSAILRELESNNIKPTIGHFSRHIKVEFEIKGRTYKFPVSSAVKENHSCRLVKNSVTTIRRIIRDA